LSEVSPNYIAHIQAAGTEFDPMDVLRYESDTGDMGFKMILHITTTRPYCEHDKYETFHDVILLE